MAISYWKKPDGSIGTCCVTSDIAPADIHAAGLVPQDWVVASNEDAWLILEQEQRANSLRSQATLLLQKSDMVGNRCFKAGIAFPVVWQNYEEQLRAVVRGESQELPVTPEYPEGT